MSFGGGPLFGSGGYYNPQGHYGPWAGCGCSSLLIIIAGIILICAGIMQMGGN
jgi:hypothetical protein